MPTKHKERIVISLGGSLIVPNGGVDTEFLKKFNAFIREKLTENTHRQFFIIAGGGAIARHYRDAAKKILNKKITRDDLDWLGIHATRLNAHLIRTIFQDIAYPRIVKHYEIIMKITKPIVIAAGWKPGWSTDYCATVICEDYHVKTLINLSNIPYAYDKDPKRYKNARPVTSISWKAFRKIVGDTWIPGMNFPFDPIASKKAQRLGLRVLIVKGDDFKNLNTFFHAGTCKGTIIE